MTQRWKSFAAIASTLIVAATVGATGTLGRAAQTPAVPTAAERPAWQAVALTDARTGDPFTLGGFEGSTVHVMPMAIWCPPCGEQLANLGEAREQLDTEEESFVFVALSSEIGLPNERLAYYADEKGFDWRFAVMTPDLLAALVDEFGRAVTVPPSTSHFTIRPDGTSTELVTGLEEPEVLVESLREAAEPAA